MPPKNSCAAREFLARTADVAAGRLAGRTGPLGVVFILSYTAKIWQGGQDSNLQPTVLETATLPIELPPSAGGEPVTWFPDARGGSGKNGSTCSARAARSCSVCS